MSLTLYLLVMKLRVLHWRLCLMSEVLRMLRVGRHCLMLQRRWLRRLRRWRRAGRVLMRVHLMGLLHCTTILLHVRGWRTVTVRWQSWSLLVLLWLLLLLLHWEVALWGRGGVQGLLNRRMVRGRWWRQRRLWGAPMMRWILMLLLLLLRVLRIRVVGRTAERRMVGASMR